MSAIAHNLTQGTSEWNAHRKNHCNASEASAMLNISPYMSRDELLEEKATGISKPIDKATQAIFDEGHRLEAQARPIAETIIGEDLFSPTMSKTVEGLSLSASFDGLTMFENLAWEHKTMNEKLRVNLAKDIIPECYKPQLEQQLLVSGADKVLFMASNDDEEMHVWYESDELLRKRLIHGWKQFQDDLRSWKAQETVVEPIAKSVEQLPSLNVQITGGVTASNLATYEANALSFIQGINTDLQTDSDFADADAIVKFCGKTEKELKQVKQAALDQTEDIAALFKTIDHLSAEMRLKRLELDKLVKARKVAIKQEIVQEAKAAFVAHVETLNQRLPEIAPFVIAMDSLDAAVKNKRTIESLRNAVNAELANLKIASNEHADLCEGNIKALKEIAADYGFLFHDLKEIANKDRDDLLNLAKQRIAEHKEAEAKRLEAERERIRKEEEAKAQAKVAAEQRRIAMEEERAHMLKQDEERKAARIEAESSTEKTGESNDHQKKKPIYAPKNGGETAQESKGNQESTKSDAVDYNFFNKELSMILFNLADYSKADLRSALLKLADEV